MISILDEIKEMAENAVSYELFYQDVVDTIEKYYPVINDRQEFYYTSEYQEINKILYKVMSKFNV